MSSLSDNNTGNRKVFVYMLDGARADALAAIKAPVWEKLCNNSWHADYRSLYTLQAFTAIDVEPSSAANHVSIATGLNGSKHKILSNEQFKEYDPSASPSFMEYLGRMAPGARSAFIFGWADDCNLIPVSGRCTALSLGSESANCRMLCSNLLAREPIPELIFFHDDEPDHGGHQHGFYPISKGYKDTLQRAMDRFERIMETIAGRESFLQEDWLFVLCSDHGGCGRIHGTTGGHSSTVPLLLAGRNLTPGMIDGVTRVTDIAPAVLAHFNWHGLAESLDGRSNLHAAVTRDEPLMLCDFQQQNKFRMNASAAAVKLSENQDALELDIEQHLDEREFTVMLELDIPQWDAAHAFDILGNRSSQASSSYGFSLYWHNDQLHLNTGCQDAPLTFQIRRSDQINLGAMICPAGSKSVAGITLNKDNTITFYHQNDGEDLCWICENSSGIRLFNSEKWQIASAAVTGISCWNRAMNPEEFAQALKNKFIRQSEKESK